MSFVVVSLAPRHAAGHLSDADLCVPIMLEKTLQTQLIFLHTQTHTTTPHLHYITFAFIQMVLIVEAALGTFCT